MNIAFCTRLVPERKEYAILPGNISYKKVIEATIKGVEANTLQKVQLFNLISLENFPAAKKIFFKTEKWSHRENTKDIHIGYINLLGIKYITQCRNLYRELDRWVSSLKGEPCVIYQYNVVYPVLKATVKLKKKYGSRVQLCMNVGDVPPSLTGGMKNTFRSKIKSYLYNTLIEKKNLDMLRQIDSYIFVTEPMTEIFGAEEKPHCVVECVYRPPAYAADSSIAEDLSHKTVFYAGSLREEYGIRHLLDAFSAISDPDYRLVIAGAGNGEEVVREYAQKDSRVVPLGFVSPQEVWRQQQLATVLVSPRTNDREFVKYSFPSKAVDSLAAGKPYVAHRLDCDPPEYGNYIQYAGDDSDEALKNKLVEICELPYETRKAMGEDGRNFILTEKTPERMCKKIVDMWRTQLNE